MPCPVLTVYSALGGPGFLITENFSTGEGVILPPIKLPISDPNISTIRPGRWGPIIFCALTRAGCAAECGPWILLNCCPEATPKYAREYLCP